MSVKTSRFNRRTPKENIAKNVRVKPDVHIPLLTSLESRGTNGDYVYSRASKAVVMDHEGMLYHCKSEEARFAGVRRVANYCPAVNTANFSDSAGLGTLTDITGLNSTPGVRLSMNIAGSTFLVTPTVYPVHEDTNVAAYGTNSIYIRRVGALNPATEVYLLNGAMSYTYQATDIAPYLTEEWQRFSGDIGTSLPVGLAVNGLRILGNPGDVIEICCGQTEAFPIGCSNKNPSEFLNPGTDYGANVPGVKYFNNLNGNTVDATSRLVIEAQGTDLPQNSALGILVESARTNHLLSSSGIPGSLGVVAINGAGYSGIDWPLMSGTRGVSLIPVVDTGIKFTRTAGSLAVNTQHVFSFFISTGTYRGTLKITAGDSNTVCDMTLNCSHESIAGKGFVRIYQDHPALTVTKNLATAAGGDGSLNLDLKVATVTSSGVIGLGGFMLEQGAYCSSFIPTIGTASQRIQDVCRFPVDYPTNHGSFICQVGWINPSAAAGGIASISSNGSDGARLAAQGRGGYNFFYLGSALSVPSSPAANEKDIYTYCIVNTKNEIPYCRVNPFSAMFISYATAISSAAGSHILIGAFSPATATEGAAIGGIRNIMLFRKAVKSQNDLLSYLDALK